MPKEPRRLKLAFSNAEPAPKKSKMAIIVSITQIQEVAMPWYRCLFAVFRPNPYFATIQEFREGYTCPMDIPIRTRQCNSVEELRACLTWEKQRLGHKGKIKVIDYTHRLAALEAEFTA